MGVFSWFCVYSVLARAFAAPPAQVPLGEQLGSGQESVVFEHVEKTRPLHGRFLHITGSTGKYTRLANGAECLCRFPPG